MAVKITGKQGKYGIIKHNTPVIIGEYDKESKTVFKKIASNKNAPVKVRFILFF